MCRYALVFLVSIFFTACRKTTIHATSLVSVKLAQSVLVNRSTTTTTVRLDSIEDSRCPINVECFWKGVAIVKLTVTVSNTHSFKLSTINNGYFPPTDTVIENHRFQLVNVLPRSGETGDTTRRVELNVD